jgi:hypothetical protein
LINRNKEILFSYWSHRDQKQKQQRLEIDTFLKRYLIHQPRSGTHSIRYYGLYASQSEKKRKACEKQLGKVKFPETTKSGIALTEEKKAVLCDCCQGIIQLNYVIYYSGVKSPGDRFGIVQVMQDIEFCKSRYPNAICKPIALQALQFLSENDVAILELSVEDNDDTYILSVIDESHYKLVSSDAISGDEVKRLSQEE